MATVITEYNRLRQYLNPTIQGPNTTKILESIAAGTVGLVNNVEAVNDSLYIVTAQERYLDALMAERNIVRPDNVGLADDVFRQIGIQVVNRKQIRDLIHKILEIMYGYEYTRATSASTILEPYALQNGDNFIMQFDDGEQVEITFTSGQFVNITAATAQEVADAITKEISRLGRTGSGVKLDDGSGGYVTLVSDTIGPASSIKVLGGKAQNKFRFSSIRPTSGVAATQWTVSQSPNGNMRMTWSAGPNPSIGKVKVNDYINVYGSGFNTVNKGTFTVSNVQSGLVGSSYVEFDNPNGVNEIVLQGTTEGVLFFYPERKTLINNLQFACGYQTEKGIFEVFLPACTKVIRRYREGSAHLQNAGASIVDQYGPYIFDITKKYVIGSAECNTTQVVDNSTGVIIAVDDSTNFPDVQGNVIFGFGTALEEGPIPYISRPSTNSLMISPSYRFLNSHAIGTNISIVSQNSAVIPNVSGLDYQFYCTDIVSGRIYCQDTIESIAATGITFVFNILYPNDVGLGKAGTVNSEKTYVWG